MEALEGFGDRYNLLWKLWKVLDFGDNYNLLWKLWKDLESGITCYGSFGSVWRQV